MAYENIEISYGNFCLGPQIGTIATIDTSDVYTRLIIKNFTGGIINTLVLSSNVSYELVGIEYTGPRNLNALITGLTFFTCERISSSNCRVRRWETNTTFSTLDLKQTINLTDSTPYFYDALAFAVENYQENFSFSSPGGLNFIYVSDTSRIANGMTLFLGPSTDTDNPAATETVTVSHVVADQVFLTSGPVNYQYVSGDPVSFHKNFYIVSSKGYAGDPNNGSIIKLHSTSGLAYDITNSGEYKSVTAACWGSYLDSVALVMSTQAVFIQPYTFWQKWRSMYLNNVNADNYTVLPIYDLIIDELDVYKLMRAATYRNDGGNKQTESWSTYNFQEDTILPYTSSMNIWTDQATLKPNETTTIYVRVRNQFGFSLSNKDVNFYQTGDPNGEFDPVGGLVTTDINGLANIDYTSGFAYDGVSTISARTDGSSPGSTGSQYVWNSIRIFSDSDIDTELGEGTTPSDPTEQGWGGGLTQYGYRSGGNFIEPHPGELLAFHVYDPYKTTIYKRTAAGTETEVGYPPTYIICKSYVTSPTGEYETEVGQDWATKYSNNYERIYWPWFYIVGGRDDGPPTKAYFSTDGGSLSPPDAFSRRASYIKQVLNFTQVPEKELRIKQGDWFLIYHEWLNLGHDPDDGVPPFKNLRQIEEFDSDLQMSQLKLSAHTHYVDGDPYDELWTYIGIDQFIFIDDAIPAFFSEKNARDTSIWIRLNPFAFDLNGDPYDPNYPFRFYIREVYVEDDVIYDSDYYDVAKLGTVTPVTGQIPTGIEFFYQTPFKFHHNAIIYVHLEIYDEAPTPNYIYTDYWFKIIPDFNRPYLENLSPDREENWVPVDTEIYFEIKDDGAGVDIDTLEVFLSSRIITPTEITKISDLHYTVRCELPDNLQHGKTYAVQVKVSDVSENRNVLRDTYRFYTAESDAPWFIGFDPRLCKRGMPRFSDVSFLVLGTGDGVDEETIRIQVHQKDVTDKSSILPVIYRVS